MRVCGYEGALSAEVKASPCVSQGLRSTHSLDPTSVCAATPGHECESRGSSSPASLGAAPADLVGKEGRRKSWRKLGCKGIVSHFLSMYLSQLSRQAQGRKTWTSTPQPCQIHSRAK